MIISNIILLILEEKTVFSGYTLTEFERKIEKMYKERNILTPEDLNLQNVAKEFNVKLRFSDQGPQRAIWDEEFSVIFIDPNKTEEKQREAFFHELGHPILHCGNQTKDMNRKFRELQEAQANQFQLYAAIPFFMLKELELPKYEYQILKLIQSVFKVPESLAKKRLEQIKRRILQTKINNNMPTLPLLPIKMAEDKEKYEMETYPLLEDLFSPNEIKQYFSSKTKNMNTIYFGMKNGQPIPLWYCIEVNRADINWSKKMHLIPIDSEFDILPVSEFKNNDNDGYVVEMFLHPSYPNHFAVDLKALKKQLYFFDIDPYNVRRIVIDANFLEKLLELNLFGNRLLQELTNI
jgi:Zn-dependent peptidase ImmA (M78 family)